MSDVKYITEPALEVIGELEMPEYIGNAFNSVYGEFPLAVGLLKALHEGKRQFLTLSEGEFIAKVAANVAEMVKTPLEEIAAASLQQGKFPATYTATAGILAVTIKKLAEEGFIRDPQAIGKHRW